MLTSKLLMEENLPGNPPSATTNLKWWLLYFLVDRQDRIDRYFLGLLSQPTVALCDSERLSGWVRQRAICGLYSCPEWRHERGSTAASRVQLGSPRIIEQDTKINCLSGGLMAGCNGGWMDGWMDDKELEIRVGNNPDTRRVHPT